MITDKSGNYSSIWRPYHYIGLELAQSIYSISLDKKSTGETKFFNAEVIAVAKKNLNIGDVLDGEGGFAARGKLISSKDSLDNNFLPLGLSDGATIKKEIKKDNFINISDVNINWNPEVLKARNYQTNLIK
jgi:Predicted homoserine dehydrogenase